MSQFMADNKGIMGLTLSTIGLMIASAIILTAALSFISFNDMQRNNELKTVASQISTLIQAMDAKFNEDTIEYWLPTLGYDYTVTLSTEYVTVSSEGFWNNQLSVKKRFIINPWVQNETLNPDWIGGNQLHDFLKHHWQYLAAGTFIDPIQRKSSWEALLTSLNHSRHENLSILAKKPLVLNPNKPIIIDKTMLYFSQPDEFYESRLGKLYTTKDGSTSIVGDDLRITSGWGGLLGGSVTYAFLIPYEPSNVHILGINIYYKAIHDSDKGPQLSLVNWKGVIHWLFPFPIFEDTTLYKLNNEDPLGPSNYYTWYNESMYYQNIVSDDVEVIHELYGYLVVDIRTIIDWTWGSDIYINRVCVKATPANPMDSQQQDYIFIYQ